MRLRFGECVLDFGTRELSRNGRVRPISPKAFGLLALLIENRPNAVSKQRIHDVLWPGAFVVDGNLANLVSELRGALGDRPRNSRVIRTVPRFGYAFTADARSASAAASRNGPSTFGLIRGDREIELVEGEHVLGRDEASVARIDASSVSRRHARLVVFGDRATIEDLGSKNGTFVEGRRIREPAPLGDGDRIRIGTVELVFRRYMPNGSTLTASTK